MALLDAGSEEEELLPGPSNGEDTVPSEWMKSPGAKDEAAPGLSGSGGGGGNWMESHLQEWSSCRGPAEMTGSRPSQMKNSCLSHPIPGWGEHSGGKHKSVSKAACGRYLKAKDWEESINFYDSPLKRAESTGN